MRQELVAGQALRELLDHPATLEVPQLLAEPQREASGAPFDPAPGQGDSATDLQDRSFARLPYLKRPASSRLPQLPQMYLLSSSTDSQHG